MYEKLAGKQYSERRYQEFIVKEQLEFSKSLFCVWFHSVLSIITELIWQVALKKPAGHTILDNAEGMFEGKIELLNCHDQPKKQPGKTEMELRGQGNLLHR